MSGISFFFLGRFVVGCLRKVMICQKFKFNPMYRFVLLMAFPVILVLAGSCKEKESVPYLSGKELDLILEKAVFLLDSLPVTVTSQISERSAGDKHDFYSEGDYWWPDPENPTGPYIQKDGQSNPENFSHHRLAMVRLSEHVALLTSAWLISGEKRFAEKANEHLSAWFVDSATFMNPHMEYAQAIWGRNTGRGIGLIDAYHLVEVAQSAKLLMANQMIPSETEKKVLDWFSDFQKWMTTHSYGIDEMNAKNNHGTTWVATAAAMASLTGNKELLEFCSDRFKNVLLPNQMAENGSFPLELNRTKPYAYSLFNMDAFCVVAQILITQDDDLWDFETEDGKSLRLGMEFIYPYLSDKNNWPYKKDIFIWEEWPVRQPSLLFAGMAYRKDEYIQTYLNLPAWPNHPEVIRNLPVRHPVIWIFEMPNVKKLDSSGTY
jgi:hypothetical protein